MDRTFNSKKGHEGGSSNGFAPASGNRDVGNRSLGSSGVRGNSDRAANELDNAGARSGPWESSMGSLSRSQSSGVHASNSVRTGTDTTAPMMNGAGIAAFPPELIRALALIQASTQQQQHQPPSSLIPDNLSSSSSHGGGQGSSAPRPQLNANNALALARSLSNVLQGTWGSSSQGIASGGGGVQEQLALLLLLQQQQQQQGTEASCTTISHAGSSRGGSRPSPNPSPPPRPQHHQEDGFAIAHDQPAHDSKHKENKSKRSGSNRNRKRNRNSNSSKPFPKETDSNAPLPASSTEAPESAQGGRPFLLPCRARGMPPDHNFRYAHFVIPSTVQHGEELICSYEACRNAGIKFRYCASCRIPVAKRNFNQRHSHGLPRVATVHSTWTRDLNTPAAAAAVAAVFGDVDSPPSSQAGAPAAAKSAMHVGASAQATSDASESSESTTSSNTQGDNDNQGARATNGKMDSGGDSPDHAAANDSVVPSNSDEADQSTPAPDSSASSDKDNDEVDEEKRGQKRKQSIPSHKGGEITVSVPMVKKKKKKKKMSRKDKKKMKKRSKQRRSGRSVNEVLHLPSTAQPPLLLEPNPAIPIDRQWRWATLLGNRPKTVNSDSMSAWLLEVMAVSDLNYPLRNRDISSLTHSSSDFSSSTEDDDDDDDDDDVEDIVNCKSTSSVATSNEDEDESIKSVTTSDESSEAEDASYDKKKQQQTMTKKYHHNKKKSSTKEKVEERQLGTRTAAASHESKNCRYY